MRLDISWILAVQLVLSLTTLLFATAVTAVYDEQELGNPQDGCKHGDSPPKITCPDGQQSLYISQNINMCAHYTCPKSANNNDDNGDNSSSIKSVVLPAVLGTIIPLLVIGGGVFFYFNRRRRQQSRRSADASHDDAKYMPNYNNLRGDDDDDYGYGYGYSVEEQPRSSALYSSTYSASNWRDSVVAQQMQQRTSTIPPNSQGSIPIIFSEDFSDSRRTTKATSQVVQPDRESKVYSGDQEPTTNRETRLYNASAISNNNNNNSNKNERQWAAPNVVNLKQMPQMVVVKNSGDSPSSANLAVDTTTTNRHSISSLGSSSRAPISPETPESLLANNDNDGSQTHTVQAVRPVMLRSLESSQKPQKEEQEPSCKSPLRAQNNNGWDSDDTSSDEEESGSDDSEGEYSSSPSDDDSRIINDESRPSTAAGAAVTSPPFENNEPVRDSFATEALNQAKNISF